MDKGIDQGCKSGLVKKSETLVNARSTWVYRYMLAVVTCAWRVKSGAASPLNSNIITNDEIITFKAGSYRIFFFIKGNIGVIF